MLKILVLIVFSFSISFSKILPIVQNIKIYIPVKQFSVIEFPFIVKEKKFTPFVYKIKKEKELNESYADPLKDKIKLPSLKNKNITQEQIIKDVKNKFSKKKKKVKRVFSVNWGKNFAQFFPEREGKTEMIVWGYKKYPILITLIATKNKSANKYIKFVDYDKKFTEIKSFKNNSHEKICNKLIYFLYNNINPSGYKVETKHKFYQTKNLRFIQIKSILGRFYSAVEYKVTNIGTKRLLLNEPMFASKNTYAISILNRELKPGETTRMFVVVPTIR